MTSGAVGPVEEAAADAIRPLIAAAEWLWSGLEPVRDILAGLWPPALAILAAVCLLRAVRYLLLLWRGRSPRVQISPFAWATSDGAEREATWVTSLFREKLAALRMDALDPLPERAPGAPLVEIVEGVGQGVGRDIGAAAGRLFKAVWPDSAYEVWGTVRPREGGGGRISVQLIERRRGNRTLLNVALEEADWEEGAREAAMAVAGALYPRVRKGERGPWTLWRRSVPCGLMRHYHDACRFEDGNRLEQALASYQAALELDPLNPNLRLKIAMLQERLELYLDAWVNYEAIVDEPDWRAWRGPDRRVYLLALYRLAVMLSNGCVAEQWVKRATVGTDDGSLRDRERHERRRDLLLSLNRSPAFNSPPLLPRLLPLEGNLRWISWLIRRLPAGVLMEMLCWIEMGAVEALDVLRPFKEPSPDERFFSEETERHRSAAKERERQIEAVLQILGLRRLEELEIALRRFPPPPRNLKDGWIRRASLLGLLRRPELGRSAVRTSKLLVRTRIAATLEIQVKLRAARDPDFSDGDGWIREIREAHRKLTGRWPFPAENGWREALRWIAPRRRWENLREDAWQLHYNAACAVASMLREDAIPERYSAEIDAGVDPDEALRPCAPATTPKRIARHAVKQLEEYAFRAGSDRVAAQADWVAIDDPDLRGLRTTDEFALWASHHLPRRVPQNPTIRQTDVKRFTIRVMHEGAQAFAAAWRERAVAPYPAAAELVEWWRGEAKIWESLANACREHLSWQQRLSWLTMLQDWFEATHRKEEVNLAYEPRGTAVSDSMSQNLFDELAALARADHSPNGTATGDGTRPALVSWVEGRIEYVEAAYEAGEERADRSGVLREAIERREALRAARVWRRLAEVLELELSGACRNSSREELQQRLAAINAQLEMTPRGDSPFPARRLRRIVEAVREPL